jgi:hypothetical protein
MKREHDSIEVRAQKMMKGRVELYAKPTMVQTAKQTTKVTQMTFPHERQIREQR